MTVQPNETYRLVPSLYKGGALGLLVAALLYYTMLLILPLYEGRTWLVLIALWVVATGVLAFSFSGRVWALRSLSALGLFGLMSTMLMPALGQKSALWGLVPLGVLLSASIAGILWYRGWLPVLPPAAAACGLVWGGLMGVWLVPGVGAWLAGLGSSLLMATWLTHARALQDPTDMAAVAQHTMVAWVAIFIVWGVLLV